MSSAIDTSIAHLSMLTSDSEQTSLPQHPSAPAIRKRAGRGGYAPPATNAETT